jgi:hypothetical protein
LGTPNTPKMPQGKLKILRIDETGRVSNKKINTLKLKMSPKKRKKLLEEIAEVEIWCKKYR